MATKQILGSENTVTTSIRDEIGDRTVKFVEIEGLMSTLELQRNSLAQSECPSGYTVDTTSLASTGDGMGKLTVRCILYGANGATFSATRTTYRIDMQEVHYELEDHPHLKTEREVIVKWLSTDESMRSKKDDNGKVKYYYIDNEIVKEITSKDNPLTLKFIAAYNAGIKSFMRYFPVIEEISLWKNPPGLSISDGSFSGGSPTFSDNVGEYDTPPITLNGYASSNWFKSKDSWINNADKTWTRTQQWTYTPEASNGTNGWVYNEL